MATAIAAPAAIARRSTATRSIALIALTVALLLLTTATHANADPKYRPRDTRQHDEPAGPSQYAGTARTSPFARNNRQRPPLLLSHAGREIVLAATDDERTPALRHTDLDAPESGLATTGPAPKVWVTAYLDLLCPDSRAFWPALKQVYAHLAPCIHVQAVLFPLPYHRNAFILSQGAWAVVKVRPALIVPYVDWVFARLEELGNPDQRISEAQFRTQTAARVWDDLHLDRFQDNGGVNATTFADLWRPHSLADQAARAEWKAGAKQGAFGTPQVQVNGEWDRRVESFTTLDEWEDYFADTCAPGAVGKVVVRDARTDAAAAASAGARRG
ncbi:hypothetical protein GGF32_009619 [Allomyces javanicus]|nr:hypothetical protein GGF32_009619 [Allomyces javanicus]